MPNQERLPTDVRGVYRPNGKRIVVETPHDLVNAGLGVRIECVRNAWGEEGVTIYAKGMHERGLGHYIPQDILASES